MKDLFKNISTPDRLSQTEEAIVDYWIENRVFERSVENHAGAERFVFYEGPPTANGKPGVHHVMARLCKDIVCRYKTMLGYQVVRKGGWDTHGLPVEIEIEKQLNINSKDQIEAYGIAEFNQQCRDSVFKYEKDWVKFTRRIGYFLDMEDPYVTYKNPYIESVWWILAEIWRKGLLYEGHKIVPYCPRCETSLSSHEVSLGYKQVKDPSIFVKFKDAASDDRYLVWTTTPWTLISNAALAVGADFDYVRVEHKGEKLILAQALLGVLEGEHTVLDKLKGEELIGRTYEPLFDFFKGTEGAHRVLGADFVSLEDGTGIVHIAPAFGADDYELHRTQGVPLLQPVTPRGTFEDSITPWAGQWIKDADPDITKTLKTDGKLYKSAKVEHTYPFCWRCSTPLIYYARRSWYVKTTAFKDQMIAANKTIGWYPKEVGEYRFGNWLENNIDWALSRERYWGTPLPIWKCESCDEQLAIGSVEQLREVGENIPPDDKLDLHRPQVDAYVLNCKCGGKMTRVTDVIDAWFDSGAMPFAQYHYPFDKSGVWDTQFPADFICEGIDQSRGWFYSLLAISTFLKGATPYKNCLVTELILDKTGSKMSKSKGNVVEPWDVLNKEGADALRWYLIHNSQPWLPTRFDRKGVVEAGQKLLSTLRNVYSFFAMYASLDGFRAGKNPGRPNLLDRWLLSRFNTVVGEVREQLDGYDMTRAARTMQDFVLGELSNWYVRRSRRRFWKGEMGPDKEAAYNTLYSVLSGCARLLSPYVPFVSEEIYQALERSFGDADIGGSVHLQPYPERDDARVDKELEDLMDTAVKMSSLGRTVRNEAGVKIRQPLSEMRAHDNDGRVQRALAHQEVRDIVLDELHIKSAGLIDDIGAIVKLEAKPAFPVLGKRFGKTVPQVVEAIKALDQDRLGEFLQTGEVSVSLDGQDTKLGRDELSVAIQGQPPYAAWEENGITVALNLEIDDALRLEGVAREIVNRLQNLRKKAGYDVSDRIHLRYQEGDLASRVFAAHGRLIGSETLAVSTEPGRMEWPDQVDLEFEGEELTFWVKRECH